MTNELIALANGREMGSVIYRNARLSFIYEESRRQDGRSYPLSLSMPLASSGHGHSRVERFLWGLLPDNDRILENWAKRLAQTRHRTCGSVAGALASEVANRQRYESF
jgi:serine/threonine-protein kinase HipA